LFVFVFSGPKKENVFSIGQKKLKNHFKKTERQIGDKFMSEITN